MTDRKPEQLLITGGAADFLQQLPPSNVENMVDRVLGDYRLKSLIGEGGMGRVYRAERTDGKFERDVAIKISHASSLSASLRARFLREQHILASINHPNVASLFGELRKGFNL
ncbi:MAG: protein kinase [Pseudomonadota bacterium]